jgi:hypothetical protein
MRRLYGMIAAGMVALSFSAYSQIVTFNSPLSWVTQRNDSITVRCQIDTALIKGKKEFSVTVQLVDRKSQKKQLAKKSFPVTDYSGEFNIGTINQVLVGGHSYLKINWAIPGSESKGYISPVGIATLDKLPPVVLTKIIAVKDGADAAAVAAGLKETDYLSFGTEKCAFAWTKEALYIVLAKQPAPAAGCIRFALDGKNGKNAFLSFADRVVEYHPATDSLGTLHYSRAMYGDTLKYETKPWPSEIKKSVSGDKIVISIPWFDSGIMPFGERKFGIGISTFDAKEIQTSAYPSMADFYLPATWGDYELAK